MSNDGKNGVHWVTLEVPLAAKLEIVERRVASTGDERGLKAGEEVVRWRGPASADETWDVCFRLHSLVD